MGVTQHLWRNEENTRNRYTDNGVRHISWDLGMKGIRSELEGYGGSELGDMRTRYTEVSV